jgi:hypothetical protein
MCGKNEAAKNQKKKEEEIENLKPKASAEAEDRGHLFNVQC